MARESRPWAWLLTITLGFPATVGAALPAGVATETVEFKGSGGTTRGFLAKPRGEGPFPAIVVVHEWWGLTDWIKENTGRLAELGFVALAVDLYDGKVTQDPGEAHELMRALD